MNMNVMSLAIVGNVSVITGIRTAAVSDFSRRISRTRHALTENSTMAIIPLIDGADHVEKKWCHSPTAHLPNSLPTPAPLMLLRSSQFGSLLLIM